MVAQTEGCEAPRLATALQPGFGERDADRPRRLLGSPRADQL
jgi:hypothetical protein